MLFLVQLLPKKLISYCVGRIAALRWPRALAARLIPVVARILGLNESESEQPFAEYNSVQELFTRNLRSGLRPLEAGVVSPVDGWLREAGAITAGSLLLVKGISYKVEDLLGEATEATKYQSGVFFNFYLCPRDYHHVHAPCDMRVTSWHSIPGSLWPVNNWALARIKNLFAVNERVAISFDSEFGSGALIMVGALNVGNIRLNIDPRSCASHYSPVCNGHRYDSPLNLKKGDRLGTFMLGSSVVLLFQRQLPLKGGILDQPVRLGRSITT
ncbi:MAG: archaetidylserine decarboxylase [Oligoflexia bacterium]|nr:archaetidylserine decarboxylase [Oligoflexia bacterium]